MALSLLEQDSGTVSKIILCNKIVLCIVRLLTFFIYFLTFLYALKADWSTVFGGPILASWYIIYCNSYLMISLDELYSFSFNIVLSLFQSIFFSKSLFLLILVQYYLSIHNFGNICSTFCFTEFLFFTVMCNLSRVVKYCIRKITWEQKLSVVDSILYVSFTVCNLINVFVIIFQEFYYTTSGLHT